MEKYTTTLITIILSLLVGGVIGYALDKKPNATIDHSMMDMDHGAMDMNHMMMDMTARMEGKTGDELDRIFLEDMIVHHQGAVDMAVILAEKTQRPELKAFAQDIIDVQDEEITMMNEWLNEWFGSQEN